MNIEEIVKKLMYFHDYIRKEKTKNYLNQMGLLKGSFNQFESIYKDFQKQAVEKEKTNYKLLTSRTLAYGLEKGFITEYELENILFLSIEDTLLNSYLYKLNKYDIEITDLGAVPSILESWFFSKESTIMQSVLKGRKGEKFVPCAYRVNERDGKLCSIRLLLLDEELVNLYGKNRERVVVAYPTIIEIDFARNLIHVRVREVDNIESENEKVSTLSKRIEERTLKYISSLKPSIEFGKFSNFKKSMFQIEEDILSKERKEAEQVLESFRDEIENFVDVITDRLNISLEKTVSPKKQIEYSVLALISSTLGKNELGDISGIRFRNIREENSKKYSEVYISDKEYKGISTDELYWNNLSVLIEQGKVEFLQLVKNFQNGTVIANLEFSLDTANAKILKKNITPDGDTHRPFSDRSYLELIDYLLPFLFSKK